MALSKEKSAYYDGQNATDGLIRQWVENQNVNEGGSVSFNKKELFVEKILLHRESGMLTLALANSLYQKQQKASMKEQHAYVKKGDNITLNTLISLQNKSLKALITQNGILGDGVTFLQVAYTGGGSAFLMKATYTEGLCKFTSVSVKEQKKKQFLDDAARDGAKIYRERAKERLEQNESIADSVELKAERSA